MHHLFEDEGNVNVSTVGSWGWRGSGRSIIDDPDGAANLTAIWGQPGGNGGPAPISGITIRANRLTVPGLYSLDDDTGKAYVLNGGQSLLLPVQFDAKLELNGGQSLSGSRGDDVWLFGGGADIDIGGFYFYPVLNFTDFILGDGF